MLMPLFSAENQEAGLTGGPSASRGWADGLCWDGWALFHQPELVWTAVAIPQVRR